MNITIIISLAISLFALIVSIRNSNNSKKYSEISILSGLQEFMSKKAKECNSIWNELEMEEYKHSFPINYEPLILEFLLTIKLLDNTLKVYAIKNKRSFLLSQFWVQLDFKLRSFIKDQKTEDRVSGLRTKVIELQNTFKEFYAVWF